MSIVFYLPDQDILAQIQHVTPAQQPELYNTGVKIWIGQTYHRLKQLQVPVALSHELPSSGLVVTHADHAHQARRALRPWQNVVIVSLRTDRSPCRYADFEIVQNAHSAQSPRQRHVPHWPQPALQSRDPARGTRIVNVVYKGAAPELHPQLATLAWAEDVRQLGMTWHADAATWVSNQQRVYEGIDWTDYTQADVILALRANPAHLYPTKPASKLVNAWHAGVPALLGPEVAFQELRQSPLDYIEVRSAQEALAALQRLQANPGLYQDMVEQGRMRAQAFTTEAIDERWQRTLSDLAQQQPMAPARWIRHLMALRKALPQR